MNLLERYSQLEAILPKIKEARFGQCDNCPIVNKEILIILLQEVFEDLGMNLNNKIEKDPRKYYSILRTKILRDESLSVEQKMRLSELV